MKQNSKMPKEERDTGKEMKIQENKWGKLKIYDF